MKHLVLLLLLFFPVVAQESHPYDFSVSRPWGWHTIIDLNECDHTLITNAQHIKAYVYTLCDIIGMKRYGDCQIVHFGEDDRVAGYSMFQLIETSNISGHFANASNSAYIDIFSCKPYEAHKAVVFTVAMFGAKQVSFTCILRS